MKEASLADNQKVIIGGIRFFLGGDKEREELEDESSDEDAVDVGRLKHQMGINKKSKKKERIMKNAIASVKKRDRKKNQPHPLNFSAFHLLHDPQGFAESLFSKHLQNTRSKLNLEHRLLVLQLLSRLIGLHKLTNLSFYSYFVKYLTPRQPSVTSFLASLAQATHSLVPPDVLEPLVQKIANEFVSEAVAAEVASAGLNAIREICARQPLAMNDTLLQDLVMYKKSKDKGVVMASKGLLGLYREVGAGMLKKRDRGKTATMSLRSGDRKEIRFGEEFAGGIEGIELLEKWEQEERQRKRRGTGPLSDAGSEGVEEDEEDLEGWEVDEVDTDDSGTWINVESDKEIIFDESSDEEPIEKKPKLQSNSTTANNDPETQTGEPPNQTISSSLATNRILTPSDLAKLQELRIEARIANQLPSQHKRAFQNSTPHHDDPLTASTIEGLASLSKKPTKAEKVALAQEGKPERETHKSTQAKRHAEKVALGKSTTNREKERKKNFLMTLRKAKGKQKRSLVERGKVLRAHVERGKRGGRKGNRAK